jgi:hypothetical protein
MSRSALAVARPEAASEIAAEVLAAVRRRR